VGPLERRGLSGMVFVMFAMVGTLVVRKLDQDTTTRALPTDMDLWAHTTGEPDGTREECVSTCV